jgi:hypothetical protein
MLLIAVCSPKSINNLGCQGGMPGEIASHLLAAPLVPIEAAGLAGDAAIDWVKTETGISPHEGTGDELARGYLNPFHQ